MTPGLILNLASGRARRIGDILSDLQRLAGTTAEVQIDAARLRGHDVLSACGNSAQADTLLGWTL
jgi:GDP-4-dehydro-6-deoxy-D-mannose reductase